MAKKKPEEKKVVNEMMYDYIDCPKCGGDMLFSKVVDGKKLYRCSDCKSTEIKKVK